MDLIEKAARNLTGRQRKPSAAELTAKVHEERIASEAPEVLAAQLLNGGGAEAAADRPGPPRRTSQRGAIDLGQLRSRGMVTPYGARSRIDEEFRLIKRPLLLRAFAKGADAIPNGHLIMVSSARPGEGKTFSSICLAMSIATEPDLNVLLVDADVARPRIPQVLGFESDQGLLDLVSDERIDLADVLIRTNVPNLTVLPAGRPHHLATELFASERMERIVHDMARRYSDRVIIFDSPPVLASSIPGVLALHVGQIVFVVEADRTSESAVNAGLTMVSNCKHIGLVLNRMRTQGSAEQLYTYYGYDRQ